MDQQIDFEEIEKAIAVVQQYCTPGYQTSTVIGELSLVGLRPKIYQYLDENSTGSKIPDVKNVKENFNLSLIHAKQMYETWEFEKNKQMVEAGSCEIYVFSLNDAEWYSYVARVVAINQQDALEKFLEGILDNKTARGHASDKYFVCQDGSLWCGSFQVTKITKDFQGDLF